MANGIFSRLANLWRGFLSIWISDVEKQHPEIANVKKIMEEAVSAQSALTTACNNEKLRVQGVLEFFGQDAINKVVAASPKLHETKT